MLYPWNTIGHSRQLEQLEKEIQEGNISHAYLFTGPEDVGKFHVAKIFASILLCPKKLCHECQTCFMIKNGSHPDRIMIEDDGQSIKIDDVRALVSKSNLTTQGGKRIVLIENMERMPVEAQNAFLKTLEEPSKDSIFLLTSSKSSSILSTIHSRVRTYEFSVIELKEMEKGLKKRMKLMDEEKLRSVFELAQGRCGLAIRLIENENIFNDYKQMYQRVDTFLKKNDLAIKFRFVEEIEKSPEKLMIFLDVFSRYLRKMMYDDLERKNHDLKARFSLPKVYDLFESLSKTSYLINRNVNKKLSLEQLMIQTEK